MLTVRLIDLGILGIFVTTKFKQWWDYKAWLKNSYKIYGYKYLKQLNYTCKNCDKALEKTQLVIAVLFSQMMPYIISF